MAKTDRQAVQDTRYIQDRIPLGIYNLSRSAISSREIFSSRSGFSSRHSLLRTWRSSTGVISVFIYYLSLTWAILLPCLTCLVAHKLVLATQAYRSRGGLSSR